MRHSRLSQSYQYTPLSLEVNATEVANRVQPSRWTCHTIEQMHIPELRSAPVQQSCRDRVEPTTKVRRSRLSHAAKVIRRQSAAANLNEIHHANICRNLERRIQAAQARGDERLLLALMAEMSEIVCAVVS